MPTTTIRGRAARRSSPRLALLAAAAGLGLATATPALAAIEDGYEPGGTPATTTWYGPADPAALKADRDYVAGMRAHHAGALTMAQEYLADPEASSPVLRRLAHAIVRNQRFEIGLLDEVGRNLDRPPVVLDLGIVRFAAQPMATEGLGQRQRFLKSPIPGPLSGLGAEAPYGGAIPCRVLLRARSRSQPPSPCWQPPSSRSPRRSGVTTTSTRRPRSTGSPSRT